MTNEKNEQEVFPPYLVVFSADHPELIGTYQTVRLAPPKREDRPKGVRVAPFSIETTGGPLRQPKTVYATQGIRGRTRVTKKVKVAGPPKPRPVFPPVDVQQVLALQDQGHSALEIAEILGTNPTKISKRMAIWIKANPETAKVRLTCPRCKRSKLAHRPYCHSCITAKHPEKPWIAGRGGGNRNPDVTIEKILQMEAQGLPMIQIAEKFGVAKSVVKDRLQEWGKEHLVEHAARTVCGCGAKKATFRPCCTACGRIKPR